MAAALTLLLVGCLLQSVNSREFKITIPQTIDVLRGSCMTIPCSFEIKEDFDSSLDESCKGLWKIGENIVFDSRNSQSSTITGELTGDLRQKDCTTTLNNMRSVNSNNYRFRLECDNLRYNFVDQTLYISVTENPPKPTLTPPTLEVVEGQSVSLTCSAPAPCLSHPPTLTWTPGLGNSQETPKDNEGRNKVQTSVLTFTASHLHHDQEISCTATYNKEGGGSASTASLRAAVSRVNSNGFKVTIPQTIEVLRGSCVTIPCSFEIPEKFDSSLDESCKGLWRTGENIMFDSRNSPSSTITGQLTGDLKQKDCTTTLNNMRFVNTNNYGFRLDCDKLRYNFVDQTLYISVTENLSKPTLTPPTLEVEEGQSVSLTCSAPAPCQSHPPTLTWTPGLGDSQQTLKDNEDRTKVQTSVLTFNASHLHHDQEISCTATYSKEGGSSASSASLRAAVSHSPKQTTVSVSPSGPVPENSIVTLTCSSRANPAVKSYIWYRADGGQETLIGSGQVLEIEASEVSGPFFCKAENDLGVGRSNNEQIDVQYLPKQTTVSVSPSGPVPENSNVTLTCSSRANPAVKRYTWYRADGGRETLIGRGQVLKIEASEVSGPFFCKAKNDLGAGRSNNEQIDVQYSPKQTRVSVSPSGPVPENSNVTLTCSSRANPAVKSYTWYRADGGQETLIGSGQVLKIEASEVSGPFFCKAENDLGAGRSNNEQIDVQYLPKQTTVSVSPSGPVPENSNVTLTCSSRANPAVKNYTWYRADGGQETLIGSGPVLKIEASEVSGPFFCKAENHLGAGRSNNEQIDVQYSPKQTTVSVSPSGPVPENSNVTLTCSSRANPAVKNYTWYRADGGQETLIGSGQVLNIEASKVSGPFFCKAENDLGAGRSNDSEIDVQYAPKILPSSNCTKTTGQLRCYCESLGNPSPTLEWRLDGSLLNHSDAFNTNKTLKALSFVTVSQPHERDLSTLVCSSSNSLGSATERFHIYVIKSPTPAGSQGNLMLAAFIPIVAALLVLVCVLVFRNRALRTHPNLPKSQCPGDTNTVAMNEPLRSGEENEVPNADEEAIYANAGLTRQAEPNSASLPNGEPNTEEGGSKKKSGEGSDVIYSAVNWKSKSKKKKEDSVQMCDPGSSYLEEERSAVEGMSRNFVSNALEMGSLYDEVQPKHEKKEAECEYAQVKFKSKKTQQ